MFLFLVLCACLRTLRAAPLPPASSYGPTLDASGGTVGGYGAAPNDEGQQLRSVFSILQSCLLTIFACVWTSAHPNINGPRDSWWTCAKRKGIMTVYAVIAPEAIFLWAISQRQAAKTIAEGYNEKFAKAEEAEMKTSLWRKVKDLFVPLPPQTVWRGDGQSWTRTHGYFIQMGGFILYKNGYPKEVLDFKRLKELRLDDAIDAPTVTERDLQDRSKGDTVSKGIIVLQTTWFVFQCIARAGQHLPLSELEVLTLAFAVMNAVIYGAWWNKPQGVDAAICVPLKIAEKGADECTTTSTDLEAHEGASHPVPTEFPKPENDKQPLATPNDQVQKPNNCENTPIIDEVGEFPSHLQLAKLPRTEDCHSPVTPPPQQQCEETTGKQHSWLRRNLQEDYEHGSTFFLLVRLPYRFLGFFIHPFDKMGEPLQFEPKRLRVPMFYASAVNDSMAIGKAASVFGVVFGAIHLLAWESHFPSPLDRLLWRISAITMTMAPLLALISLVTGKKIKIAPRSRIALLVLLLPLYTASRVISIIIALKAIHNPAHNVLIDISWTMYIPHF